MARLSVFQQQVSYYHEVFPKDPGNAFRCKCGARWTYRTGTYKNSRYWCDACYHAEEAKPMITYKGRRLR